MKKREYDYQTLDEDISKIESMNKRIFSISDSINQLTNTWQEQMANQVDQTVQIHWDQKVREVVELSIQSKLDLTNQELLKVESLKTIQMKSLQELSDEIDDMISLQKNNIKEIKENENEINSFFKNSKDFIDLIENLNTEEILLIENKLIEIKKQTDQYAQDLEALQNNICNEREEINALVEISKQFHESIQKSNEIKELISSIAEQIKKTDHQQKTQKEIISNSKIMAEELAEKIEQYSHLEDRFDEKYNLFIFKSSETNKQFAGKLENLNKKTKWSLMCFIGTLFLMLGNCAILLIFIFLLQ
ncbi:MAG TPA: hypothetical protein P5107_07440 [Thermotogota bacterium]|nr:hypothetical protein [Thermotogota bacterium]